MGNLLSLWYLKSPSWAFAFYVRTLAQLESSIGVRDMARNLRRPLFQDYTWQGRFIGLMIRLLRMLLGILVYAGVGLLYFAIYLIWLAFPFICLVSIAGAFLGTSGGGE